MKAVCVILVVLSLVIANEFASGSSIKRITKESESPSYIPEGWNRLNTESARKLLKDEGNTMTLTFALKQRNLKKLEKIFWEVSNPESASYGNYVKYHNLIKMIAPTSEDTQKVIDWLLSYGVKQNDITIHRSKDFLTAKMHIETAEKLLQTTFGHFQHIGTGRTFVKAVGSYSVPEDISEHIDFISGFRFPNWKTTKSHKYNVNYMHPRIRPSQQNNVEGLPSGNGPLLFYVNPLDQLATATILPRCLNGQVTTNPKSLCSDQGGSTIASIMVSANQTFYDISNSVIPANQLQCKSCADAEGHMQAACQYANQVYNLTNTTVYCEIVVTRLNNYVPTVLSLQATFSNGGSSDLSVEDQITFYVSKFTTPAELMNLYGIPRGTQVKNAETTQSVAEFLGQYYDPNDLRKFFQLMGLPDMTNNVTLIGPNDPTNPGGEATLDIEFLMGVAVNASTVFWSLPGLDNGQEPFLEWITDVLNDPNAPLVHSVSYGDDEDTLSTDYMNRVNAEFMKAGVRGMTLLFASGDNGVFGGGENSCNGRFTPSFPPTSPYVTAVGATLFSTLTTPLCHEQLYGFPVPCHIVGETVSSTDIGSRITSGGGFSNVFSTPPYQEQAVAQYLNTIGNSIPSSYYSSTGRAYPDVATIGHNYMVILGGQLAPIDGTSASTPTFAAVVTLLNDQRISNGQSPLGFINPLLYSTAASDPTAFNDIVTGNNACSELSWVCCDYGFPATVGYDAVTGLGSPNFNVLSSEKYSRK